MENGERSFKDRFWDFATEHPIITFLIVIAALDAIVAILR